MGMEARNPATDEVTGRWEEYGREQVDHLLQQAVEEYRRHRTRTFDERAKWMMRAADLLEERRDRYARTMTEEMGKTFVAARSEVEKCAWVCRYYAEKSEQFLSPERVETDASRSEIHYQPIGPVLAVMPWNFPFWQVFRFAAPALMAGNVGLLKHASNVPGSALAIEEVFADAGFPPGCFTTLLIGSSRVKEVIEDKRVVAVTLTGSEGAGRSVGASAGGRLIPVVLELGGSDPFIVMPSADIEEAVSTAVDARMINNGQSCIAAKRFILHEEIADRFTASFVKRVGELSVGDPMKESTDIGPMAREEFAAELIDQIERSIEMGANLLHGGKRLDGKGYFVEPSVLADVKPGMPLFDEETFGPAAALIRVADLEEAIEMANATRFGLGASAWTREEREISRFVEEIEAGSVFINGMVKSDPRLPFGGIKASGVGRELSRFGIREFCNIKTVWRK